MTDVAAATNGVEGSADASAPGAEGDPPLEKWFEHIVGAGVLGDLDDRRRSAMAGVVAQAAKQRREVTNREDKLFLPLIGVALVIPAVLLAAAWDAGLAWILAFIGAEVLGATLHVAGISGTKSKRASAVFGVGAIIFALIAGGLIIAVDESPSIAMQLVIAASLFWAVETLWIVFFTTALWIDDRVHTGDPLAEFIYALVYALRRLPRTRVAAGLEDVVEATTDVQDGLVWPLAERRAVASALEEAAETAKRDLARLARNREARAALSARGARIAAWFRAREVEILMPSPTAPGEVEAKLATALAAACEGRWNELEAEPAPKTPLSLARRLGPRMAVVIPLAAVAIALPSLLSGVLSADEIERIQFALLIGVAGALVAAPGPAVSGTIQDVRERLFK